MTPRARSFAAALAALLLLPRAADGCPVCFGAAASPLLDAARLGVLVMVGVTLGMLVLFGRWFLRLRHLAAEHGEEHPPVRAEVSR